MRAFQSTKQRIPASPGIESLSPETHALLADANTLVAEAFAAGLRPPPDLTVAEWADKYRYLSSVSAAEPGRYRTSRTPYWREVMEAMSARSPVSHIAIRKPAQVGFTEILINFILYTIAVDPTSTLMFQPTEAVIRRTVEGKIDPAIAATPSVREKLPNLKSRSKGQRTLSKQFPGGMITFGGVNSPHNLRAASAQRLLLDEVDAYPLTAEGHPCELALKRTATYPNRKVVEGSTPLIAETSRIDWLIARSDDRRFLVPCPHCDRFQELVFNPDLADGGFKPHGSLVWEKGRPDTARYKCAFCEKLFDESHKTKLLAAGDWKPTGDVNSSIRGYSINGLYVPAGWDPSWPGIASEFLAKKDRVESLRVFVNTVIGTSFAERGQAPDHSRLYERRETYKIGTVPAGALALTAAVDVQKDRLEYEVKGWGPMLENWSIEYGILMGDPDERAVWEALEQAVILRAFPHKLGGDIPVLQTAIDSGYLAHHVYNFTRRQNPDRVLAVKGSSKPLATPLAVRPTFVDVNWRGQILKHGAKVYLVDVSALKGELYTWLNKPLPSPSRPEVPGACHFPEYDEDYFQGLTAEVLRITHDKFNREKRVWAKITPDIRNEPLDLAVYNRAAALRLKLDQWTDEHWQARLEAARGQDAPLFTRPKRGQVRGRYNNPNR